MCQKLYIPGIPGGGRCAGTSGCGQTSRQPCPGVGVKDVERKCLDMAGCVKSAESPCWDCCLVPDPTACNNKNCRLWQQWFTARWDAVRGDWLRKLRGVGQ